MLTNKQLLEKAALETADFGGAGEARLTIEQAAEFIRIAQKPQAMLSDVRTVTNKANSWEENKISFGRILHAASEVGETGRLTSGQQTKPGTGIVVMETKLFRGEVLISDSIMEDNVEHEGFGGTISTMVAERCGVDVEDIFINGNIGGGHAFYGVLNGWLTQVRNGPDSHVRDASGDADFQATLKALLSSLPSQFKVDKTNMRYYVSDVIEEAYRDLLSTRGTPLGDLTLEGTNPLKYQGIPIKPVPLFPVDIGFSPVLLTHRQNLYAGWRRAITLEPYRDPRDGGTTFIVSCRIDARVGHLDATALAENVPTGDLGS